MRASAIDAWGENGTASSSSLRDSIFEKSRMSFRIDNSVSADVRAVARLSRCSAVSSLSSTRSVMPMTPFIGVRISWLMFARNSLLARLASIARSRAITSSSLFAWSSAVRASTVASRSSCCIRSCWSRRWMSDSIALNWPISSPISSSLPAAARTS